MRRLFGGRRSRGEGWLAISLQSGALAYAHGERRPNSKAAITLCGSRAIEAPYKGADKAAKDLGADRYRCLTVLSPEEYQLLLVDAPKVPAAELKQAVRWSLKDMLDYPVTDATVDVLDIPPDPSGGGRGHYVYAVAARSDHIKACIDRFEHARIPLSVIDIGETAQRNIAALYEDHDRGLAFLYVGSTHALLTVNYRGELYLSRRIDIGIEQLLGSDAEEARNRIFLELQRSFDHFDRQFPFVGSMTKLLLGPETRETGLAAYLAANLDMKVEAANLSDVIDFGPAAATNAESAWRLFHVIGAALRDEPKNGKNGKNGRNGHAA